jgi:hypothetical protein
MANVPLFGHREPDSTSGVCVRQLHKPPKEWRDMCVREREGKKEGGRLCCDDASIQCSHCHMEYRDPWSKNDIRLPAESSIGC